MQLCGWKTDAMFRRYAILDERDLRSSGNAGEGHNGGTIEDQSSAGGRMTKGISHLR